MPLTQPFLKPRRITQNKSVFDMDGRVWIDMVDELTVGDVVYTRSGYTVDGTVSSDIDQRHFTVADESVPDVHVLCGQCHGSAFTLTYGSYCVDATCAACGFTAEVYSG